MPLDEDKYPQETGRRRFVKGVVGSAALASVSAAGAASLNTATSPSGAGGGPTQFIGIELLRGPAPRGMPIVPVTVDSSGEIGGYWPEVQEVESGGRTTTIAAEELGGITYSSSWFQYCGVQSYASAQPETEANNSFMAKPGTYEWQADQSTDTALTVDDFSDYREWGNGIGKSGLGKPAMAEWRQNEEGRPLPVQLIRSPEVPKLINGEGKYSEIPGSVRSFVDAATEENIIAWMDKCTHFCCVPQGFKTTTDAGAENHVYCQCHQSVYDPFSPVQKQFIALPRPEE
jgi:Rieske Fe-S protein